MTVEGLQGDVVDVVAARVLRRLEVGRGLELQQSIPGDLEVPAIGPGDRPGDDEVLGVVGGERPRVQGVLLDCFLSRARCGRRHGRFVHVDDGDRQRDRVGWVLGRVCIVVERLAGGDRHRVRAGRLKVGRGDELKRAVRVDRERGIAAEIELERLTLRIGGAEVCYSKRAILVELRRRLGAAVSADQHERRRFVHVDDVDRHRDRVRPLGRVRRRHADAVAAPLLVVERALGRQLTRRRLDVEQRGAAAVNGIGQDVVRIRVRRGDGQTDLRVVLAVLLDLADAALLRRELRRERLRRRLFDRQRGACGQRFVVAVPIVVDHGDVER